MSASPKLPLVEVYPTAQKLVELLSSTCSTIEIAGSLRRGAQYVSDIEIVAIPVLDLDLLGQPLSDITQLDRRLGDWNTTGRIARGDKWGSKYKKFSIKLPNGHRINVDLFITTPDCWPVIFTLRTGPSAFSKACVTQIVSGGLLRNGYRVSDGRLRKGSEPIDLKTERDFFDYIKGGWLAPSSRKA